MSLIKMPPIVKLVNELDIWDKLEIYLHFFRTKNELNNKPIFVDMLNCGPAWGCTEEKHFNIGIYRHPNINIMKFEEFIDPNKQIKITDNGEDWDKKGFAQQIRIDLFGIYDWCWKFGFDKKIAK